MSDRRSLLNAEAGYTNIRSTALDSTGNHPGPKPPAHNRARFLNTKGDGMKHKVSMFGLLLLVGTFCLPPALRAQDDCANELSATTNAIGTSGITGNANLCVAEGAVTASMLVEGLIPGNAYTVWFVVFDNPANCGTYAGGTPGVCTGADATMPSANPEAAFGRMDGLIAEDGRTARLAGHYRNLRLSHGAIVWLLMFGHGAASTTDNRELARQLLTPQKPALGAPGLGASGDAIQGGPVALAVFNIP